MTDQSISAQHLKSFIDRIERLQSEKDAISEDMKEVFAQAKSSGFDVKIMRKTIALRKLDPAERQEQEALIAVYENAIDGIVDTPLGQAAVSQARVVTAEKVRKKRAEPAEPLADEFRSEPGEALYNRALVLVLRDRKASTSFIQRHLELGYNSAARIVEEMQRRGIISAPDHVGKREVLMAPPVAEADHDAETGEIHSGVPDNSPCIEGPAEPPVMHASADDGLDIPAFMRREPPDDAPGWMRGQNETVMT